MEQDPLVLGQIVAERYRVERIIGKGGMGVVAAVRHVTLDEIYALKVLLPEAFENASAVERFVREAQTTAKLKSVHAVRIHDAGRLPTGAPYLVMEYLDGRDLEKELDVRGPLPAAEAAAYIIQACEALSEAHALGIVHRDIKSANLFLTKLPNGTTCLKVLDFGIAKFADPAKGGRMTATTAVFGTPLYMSPEQMRSAKSVDPRADIWSLGVVLYELCVGGVPFDATTMPELVTKVLTETPSFPAALRPGMSREIEPIILRCLERDLEKRYPSAAALAQALAPIAAGATPSLSAGATPSLSAGATPSLLAGQPPSAAPAGSPTWGGSPGAQHPSAAPAQGAPSGPTVPGPGGYGPVAPGAATSMPYSAPGNAPYSAQGSPPYTAQGGPPHTAQAHTSYPQQGAPSYTAQGAAPYSAQAPAVPTSYGPPPPVTAYGPTGPSYPMGMTHSPAGPAPAAMVPRSSNTTIIWVIGGLAALFILMLVGIVLIGLANDDPGGGPSPDEPPAPLEE